MQTVKVEVEDSVYQDMLKRGVNIQDEIKKMMNKAIYRKEHKIANDILEGLKEVELYKQGKIELTSAEEFLKELKREN
jgi:spore coat protein CotF